MLSGDAWCCPVMLGAVRYAVELSAILSGRSVSARFWMPAFLIAVFAAKPANKIAVFAAKPANKIAALDFSFE